MTHRQTTEIALLKRQIQYSDELLHRMAYRVEREESLASAFVFDLVQYLNGRWYTRWLVKRVIRRYEEAWKSAIKELQEGSK